MKVFPTTIYDWWIVKVLTWRMEYSPYFAQLLFLSVVLLVRRVLRCHAAPCFLPLPLPMPVFYAMQLGATSRR